MSKETFKTFARLHPELGRRVMGGDTSWQKLYELYDIYGENSHIWDDYFQNATRLLSGAATTTEGAVASFSDLFNTIKNVDLESVQKGVTNLQKTIGLLQDLGLGSKRSVPDYEARPMYKYFED